MGPKQEAHRLFPDVRGLCPKSRARLQVHFQFGHEAIQFCDPVARGLQALLLPHEPRFSFLRDADRQIPIEQNAWLAEQAESAASDWIEQRRAASFPDANRIRVERKRHEYEPLRNESLQNADLQGGKLTHAGYSAAARGRREELFLVSGHCRIGGVVAGGRLLILLQHIDEVAQRVD